MLGQACRTRFRAHAPVTMLTRLLVGAGNETKQRSGGFHRPAAFSTGDAKSRTHLTDKHTGLERCVEVLPSQVLVEASVLWRTKDVGEVAVCQAGSTSGS